MKIEFIVELKDRNAEKLRVGYKQDVGGADELWDYLHEKNIQENDVFLITVAGESTEDRAIANSVRVLHAFDVKNIIFKIDERTNTRKNILVYFTANVEAGKLVRYEISDRNDSLIAYTYSDAKAVFDLCLKKGFPGSVARSPN
jgi:hypothetical protein